MSIATQIGRIAKAKKDIKEVVNQDFEIINNETIDKYAEKMGSAYDEYESYIPWEHGEGDGFTFKKGGTGSYLKELEINGNTKQDNYTGKNLFDYITPISRPSCNGITCTIEGDIIVFNGTATADNTTFNFATPIEMKQGTTKVIAYYVSGSATTYCTLRTFDSNWAKNTPLNLLSLSRSNNKMQATSQYNYTATSVSIRFNEGSTASNFRIKIMVTDNTNTDFEPYVGGSPSPSPDFPQDVRVVTGNNSVKVVGKNLLNTNLMIEFTPNNTSWWSLDGKGQFYNATNIAISNLYYDLKANTTYTFSVYQHKNISTSVTSPIQLVNLNGNVISSMKLSDEGLKKTFTTTDAIRVYPRITPNEANVLTQCIVQLEEGSTASAYEEYQSQTYPINLGNMELCKIGDYQDYIGKSTGKNLFDKDNANIINNYALTPDGFYSETNDQTLWIPCESNTTYTISKVASERLRAATTRSIPTSYPSIYQYINASDTTNITITTDSEAKYLCIFYKRYSDTLTSQQILDTLQIEQNSQATDYEPYGEQWYIKKNIGKVVLDGSEAWSHRAFPDNSYLSIKMTLNVGASGGFCDKFISNNNYDIVKEHMTISKQWEQLCFAILKSRLSTGDEAGFKSWLSTNTPTAYYVLANPTYEIITNETLINQLEELTKLDTYNNYSAVTVTGDLINPELECVLFSQPAYQK